MRYDLGSRIFRYEKKKVLISKMYCLKVEIKIFFKFGLNSVIFQ